MRTFAFVMLSVACSVVGCSDNGQGMDMAAPDMAVVVDMTPPHDLAMPDFAGVACGNMTCGASQDCCARPNGSGGVSASCVPSGTCNTDGGAALMCDGPEDCPNDPAPKGGCCATLSATGNGDGGVTGGGAQAMCANPCVGEVMFDGSGGVVIHTKLCHVKDDCTGYTGNVGANVTLKFDSCCTSPQAGGYKFCAPGMAAGQGGITCN